MEIADVDRLAEGLAGVRRTTAGGLAQWRYRGRLVARQADEAHLVIRADFDYRDTLLREFPGILESDLRAPFHPGTGV